MTGEWLTKEWTGQLKAVRTDDAGVIYIVWRGPVPGDVLKQIQPFIGDGHIRLQTLSPEALKYVVSHAARVLRRGSIAEVDEIHSQDETSETGLLTIVVEELWKPEAAIIDALDLVAQDYSLKYRWRMM